MNIVIYTVDFAWAGGIDLLHLMVKGLLSVKNSEIKIYVLIHDPKLKSSHKQSIKKNVKTFLNFLKYVKNYKKNEFGKDILIDNQFSSFHYLHEIFGFEDVTIVYYNRNDSASLQEVVKKINATVILPIMNSDEISKVNIPKVGYIFDFVYKYLSDLYTPEFCLQTDLMFTKTLLSNKCIVVNSQKTKDDIRKFYPYAKNEIFVMPFAPFVNDKLFSEAFLMDCVKSKYNLPNPYFVISNQFWLHKSHETAFQALKVLKSKYEINNIDIVCTGRMTDLSNSDHRKNELNQLVKKLGIESSILFLGHLPKVDQMAIMLRSVAVIQPTTFEGGPGGGSVYLGVAMGVPCIVSDIDVNKEIKSDDLVSFFQVNNYEDLAQKMYNIISGSKQNSEKEKLFAKNNKRLVDLGMSLLKCIEAAKGN